MKNLKKISFYGVFAIVFALISCSDTEPEIGSRETIYPIITLSGDDPAFVNSGDVYTDPGAVATVGSEEIPLSTRFVGRYRNNVFTTLDTNVSDIYSLEYTAINADGISVTASRQVIVADTGDLVTNIAGLYRSTVRRNGVQGSPASNYTNIEYILIWKNVDGSYGISDAFGGWYLFGRAIANSETPGGIIVANNIPLNNFSFPGTQSNLYFSGTAEITGMIVDPVAKTIDVTTTWVAPGTPPTNYTFTFHLEQVQF